MAAVIALVHIVVARLAQDSQALIIGFFIRVSLPVAEKRTGGDTMGRGAYVRRSTITGTWSDGFGSQPRASRRIAAPSNASASGGVTQM